MNAITSRRTFGVSAVALLRFVINVLMLLCVGSFNHFAFAQRPVTDNQGPPYLGVAKAGPIGPNTEEFAVWLHRSTIMGETTYPFNKGSRWNSLSDGTYSEWFYKPAREWIAKGNGRILVICVPLLPGPPDRSGPASGDGAGVPVSLAEGAAGKYNRYFYAMGQNLVANHLDNSILRLGWEFNGDWYAWSVKTPADAANFAAYWKQIVDTLRTVPGQHFKFNWGGTITYVGDKPAYNLADAFPAGNDAKGNAYVDQVGVDVYDSSWSFYPWPADSTPAQILAIQQKVWSDVINSSKPYWGIPVWMAIATANHIPLTIPEWGVSTDLHAGKDNTFYVQKMFDFIQNPANRIYYAAYYDSETEQISPTDHYITTLVNSAALYRRLFTPPTPAPKH